MPNENQVVETEVVETEAVETEIVEPVAAEPTAENAVVEEPAASSDDEKHRKPGAESRISQLVKERNEAVDFAQQMQNLAMPNENPAPEDDWEDQLAGKVFQKQQQMQAAQAQQVAQQKQNEYVNERLSDARAKYPEFDAKVINNPNLAITPAMRDVMLSSDTGADVAMYLADNPAEATRIASMPNPVAQIQELTRLESRLPTPKTVSEAPAPLKAVGTGNAPADPSKLSTKDWIAQRNSKQFGG